MKICPKCGAQLDDGASFCNYCGEKLPDAESAAPQQPGPVPTAPAAQPNDGQGLSVAALVCGVLGIVGSWIPVVKYFTTVLAVLGLIFGVMGRQKSTAVHGKASGMATAGLVLGVIGVAFALLGLICTVACGALLCSAAS